LIKHFNWKFPGMRKEDSLSVLPVDADGKTFTFQGSRTIGRVDVETGKGMVNYMGSNPKYFMHLSKMMGAVDFDFPQEFINLIKENQTRKGDQIGPGIIMG